VWCLGELGADEVGAAVDRRLGSADTTGTAGPSGSLDILGAPGAPRTKELDG
jgi:hypothetical protein